MKTNLTQAACAFVLSVVSSMANAALIDRGGGLIYDADLNVTWLANANLAASNTFGVSGINPDGTMSWYTAQSWINAMNAADYLGYNDWRLPTTGPVNGTAFNYNLSYNGNTDYGQNMSAQGTTYAGSTSNEMAHLNFNSLDNHAKCSPTLSADSYCAEPSGWWGGAGTIANTGPFTNLQTNNYWSGTEYAPDTAKAWNFTFVYGSQSGNEKTISSWSALAVRSGDIATVPVPAAAWLFGSGLIGLFGVARRKA